MHSLLGSSSSFLRSSLSSSRMIVRSLVAAATPPSTYNSRIEPKNLQVQLNPNLKEKTPNHELLFGHTFTDHMLEINWNMETGWGIPQILPYGNISLPPGATALHYGIECFEGMKGYTDAHGKIRLFRPDMNMKRMDSSMQRMAMPALDKEGFLECIEELIRIDSSWVPSDLGYSLYIRPFAIGTSPYLGVHASEDVKLMCILCPVGPYYKSGSTVPVKLLADSKNVRAWPGGVGGVKVGGNYAPTIAVSAQAGKKGYSQVLWLFGPNHEITEVGAMNIFFLFRNEKDPNSALELITAPLDRGDVLPGVTRDSIINLAKSERIQDIVGHRLTVSERWLTMGEVQAAAANGRLVEAFGAGTAAIVSPVSEISYLDKPIPIPHGGDASKLRGCTGGASLSEIFRSQLLDIQYGRTEHEWSKVIN